MQIARDIRIADPLFFLFVSLFSLFCLNVSGGGDGAVLQLLSARVEA
jgi:hypothetical protein